MWSRKGFAFGTNWKDTDTDWQENPGTRRQAFSAILAPARTGFASLLATMMGYGTKLVQVWSSPSNLLGTRGPRSVYSVLRFRFLLFG